MTLIRAERLVKTYRSGEVEVHAIRGVDFTIEPKSFVVFVGPSGSGKTTLLNMIGCLDHPTSGTLTVARHRCQHAGSARSRRISADSTSASSSRTSI